MTKMSRIVRQAILITSPQVSYVGGKQDDQTIWPYEYWYMFPEFRATARKDATPWMNPPRLNRD